MGPKPTWDSYARWARWSLILTPVWCGLAVILLIIDVKSFLALAATLVGLIGVAQLPFQLNRYRHARRHVLAADPDPSDMAALRRSLRQ